MGLENFRFPEKFSHSELDELRNEICTEMAARPMFQGNVELMNEKDQKTKTYTDDGNPEILYS
ncbi:hypothetical protein HN954_04940 [bacterium]|jgi:hypothetical protein|nr:hypothetical protein [bacterium]MBT6831812.1 hypothetical protein [bacterium]MBT6996741.1 hypothetical protein [bacterium]MBT7772189.1 hypothetical protein [bacterium]